MKVQIKTWLLIARNLGAVTRCRAWIPKLKALHYQDSLNDPCYSRSAALAALHFHRFGMAEIVKGDRPLKFEVNGKSYSYSEELYNVLNPQVAQLAKAGEFVCGVDHFVRVGYDEMKSGKQTTYVDPALESLREFGVAPIIRGEQRLTLIDSGLEYDYVDELYVKSHPEAAAAVREKAFSYPLLHFISVTLPLIRQGKTRLYTEDYSPKIEKTFEGQSKSGRLLCLFAHEDAEGEIDPYVIRYLEGLKTMDCEIVFVSNCAKEDECRKVAHLCSEFILRNAYGSDFGSWFVAVKHCRERLKRYDHVIWASDKVYFPVHPVDKLIDKIDEMFLEVWGINESTELLRWGGIEQPEYHLSSFFVGFSKSAVAAGILDDFVDRFKRYPVLSRIGQIMIFEYWLAKRGHELGLRVGALCKAEVMYEQYAKLYPECPPDHQINPSIHFWRQTLAWHDSPILNQAVFDHKEVGFRIDEFVALIDPDFYNPWLVQRHAARLATGPRPAILETKNNIQEALK